LYEKYLIVTMKSPTFALCALLMCVGCASPRQTGGGDAVIIDFGPGRTVVQINKKIWTGFLGSEGHVGDRPYTCYAALEGAGPIFTNPRFEELSPFHSIGTITLDPEHNSVTVNMRRVKSKPGEPQKTARTPANGTYKISSVRKPQPGESWF